MMREHPRRWAWMGLAAAGTAAGALGQQPTKIEPPPGGGEQHRIRVDELPPNLRLGVRVAFVRQKLAVHPTVVIVPDGASYAAAVGSWGLEARFPVLIDDGSWAAREGIARFVRAFAPKNVVRWKAEGKSWPKEEGARREEIEKAVSGAWGAAGADKLAEQWASMKFSPPGVIVANAGDSSWTAALALAAGRGEPIVWVEPSDWGGDGPAYMTGTRQADTLSIKIAEFLSKTPWKWAGLGDEIDAVTLCVNCPVKIVLPDTTKARMWAMTDVVGRKVGGEGALEPPAGAAAIKGDRKDRWAWAGQIVGSEWQGAYSAMCSLFLSERTAWIFDGYETTDPWNLFDGTAAAASLEKAGFKTLVDDGSAQGLDDWRRRVAGKPTRAEGSSPPIGMPEDEAGAAGAAPGVDAGLVMVNSMGNADFFDLRPGRGMPCDAPILRSPAAVYFVHSWSATSPTDRKTVAGRWMERGAYAYVGSVHEPYLGGFVPTPTTAARLAAGMPWGAGTRLDAGEPWKITVLGDPLMVFGAAGPETGPAVSLRLGGGSLVQAEMTEALKAKRYEAALTDLTLLGRDKDAARLLKALLTDDAAGVTPEIALAGLSSAYRAGDLGTFTRAYAAAQTKISADAGLGECRDMLWQALWPVLNTLLPEEADLLGENLRADNLARDAQEASRALMGARGADAARGVLSKALRLATDRETAKAIEGMMK